MTLHLKIASVYLVSAGTNTMGMLLNSAKWELTANGKHGCRKTKENMSNQSVKIFAFCLAAPLI